jgi:hypothetical protein
VIELREMSRLTAAELSQRLVILPTEIIEGSADLHALQPMAGRFEIEGGAVYFIPRYPFMEGSSYSLVLSLDSVGKVAGSPEIWTIQRPAASGVPATSVVAVYPSASELPVNALRLYIHFSNPMSEGWAARAVHVHRADSRQPLEEVFLATETELWDRERRRLTILLDPGRIKRGLVPNMEAGYPLMEGVPVVVSIDTAFRDAVGWPLRRGAERRYEVGPPVRALVDPANWRFHCPYAGSGDSLLVEFDRPLDHALLEHSLWVRKASGLPLAGRGIIGPSEASWRFEPLSPWDAGRYAVTVDPRLEDLAGNSLIRVFDRDLMRAEDAPSDAHPGEITFTIEQRPKVTGRARG